MNDEKVDVAEDKIDSERIGEDKRSEEDNVVLDPDVGDVPDTFFDLEVWERIGKNLEDFTIDDMQNISIRRLDMCLKFYKMYAKVNGFGVRKKAPILSRVDGLPTSQTLLCNKEGHRMARHLERPDRKYKPREETRCGCNAKIIFKYDDDEEHWIVKDFVQEHNHDLVPINQVAFIRLVYGAFFPFLFSD